MKEIFLLKLGELVLKGLNRRQFEDRLMGNAMRRLRPFGEFRVYTKQSTTYVEPKRDDCDLDGAFDAMKKLFGVAALCRAYACEKTLEAMTQTASGQFSAAFLAAKSFKVESRRADKAFPMTSIQLSQAVGDALHNLFPHLIVDVHTPELTLFLEVREDAAFVHTNPHPGAGGLPVGVSGRAVCLLSGGIDSPVAAYLTAKRGVCLELVHFFSYPYTSNEAKEKVLALGKIISHYAGKLTLHIVPFTKVQEQLQKTCPEELFTLLMRRSMMRISEWVAGRTGALALVTGESIGQVASQTLEAMNVTGEVSQAAVLRPVICMDKEEIVKTARKIGTFETSILPYEDCCTVFTPRRPKIRPNRVEVREAEAGAMLSELERAAFEGIETVVIG